MKYSCDHCSYETDKKSNYSRHLNRKFKCNKGGQNVHANFQNVHADFQNVHADFQNVHAVSQNVHAVSQNVHAVQHNKECATYECTLCNKVLSSKHSLIRHKEQCTGNRSNKCQICLKTFETRKGKYQHQRYVLCHPPPPPMPVNHEPSEQKNNTLSTKEPDRTTTHQPTSLINTTNTTNTNSHNITQTTSNSHNNNTVNNVNNIIQYNAFGDEGIEQLGKFLLGRKDDSEIIERMRHIGKKKLYGVREMQNDIFFNPNNPEGFSIIKPEKYGSSVRVRNSDGEFEYMEFSDIRDPLFNYMEKYVDIYNQTRNKYNVKFRDPREKRILQNFFKIMNDDLDIYLGEDLKDDLNIKNRAASSLKDEEDEVDEEKKYKRFDKVSLDNLHTQTKKFYKCKKGEFILKDN